MINAVRSQNQQTLSNAYTRQRTEVPEMSRKAENKVREKIKK